MLTEATRKTWISLILSKIRSVTKSLHMFNPSQHGYVPGRGGTTTASLLFINILETAKMDGGVSNRTSYDMSKAFDTVSKNIQKIAWSRMGVPSDVVDWLVDMDTDGVTVVRSPYALEKWDTHDYRSIITTQQPDSPPSSHPATVIPLTATRGTGQGNPDSPTCWNAVFDIALTALTIDAQERGTEQYATGKDGNSTIGSELGYADDLVSVHELASEIQRKADIMSAFCAICGVTLSHKKLRRVTQSWLSAQRR